jgi:phosphatidylserine decarboxylase
MQDFLDALKLIYFPIHREGYKFVAIFAIITAILAIFSSKIGLIGLVLTIWCVFFFRDPERIIPVDDNIIVSPADGKVIKVEFGVDAPKDIILDAKYKDVKWNKISVFLNVFNVHVNRIPLSGKIIKTSYKPGKFLSANVDEASEQNERNAILLQDEKGNDIIFVQVAGMVARRIISDVKEGQNVKIGDRYGIIRFGSRADMYFPENIEIKALLGQTMIGGETVIAKIK